MKLILKDGQELTITRANDTYSYEGYKDGFLRKYYRKNNMSKRMKNYVPDEWALEIISESELNMLKELERED